MERFPEIVEFLARHRGARSLFLCKLISACWNDSSQDGRLQAAMFGLILECCQDAEVMCAVNRKDAAFDGKQWKLQLPSASPSGRVLALPSLSGILLDDWLRIRPAKPEGPLFFESASRPDRPMTLEKLQEIFAFRMKQAVVLTTLDDFRVVASQINYGISRINLKGTEDALNRSDTVSLSQPVGGDARETVGERVSSPRPNPEREAAIREADRARGVLESRQKGAVAFDRAEQDGRIAQALGDCRLSADQRYVMALLLFTSLTQAEIARMRHSTASAVDNIKDRSRAKLQGTQCHNEIEARLEEKKR